MKCAACARETAGQYCRYHEQALEQLRGHYEAWVQAYGTMEWGEYLARLLKMPETGAWVKEVIEAEIEAELKK
jgi:hypothetical protein